MVSMAVLLNKDVWMFLIRNKISSIKKNFWKRGGFASIRNWIYVLIILWGLHTFFREKGWLKKKSVKGKHIYLTGAGSGLGRGMAIKFAKRGANLTISDINEEGLIETKTLIKSQTGKDENILTIKLDVANREAIKESAEQARTKFGNVDILINNAGIVQGKSVTELNEKLASKSLIVNMECHLWLVREFIPAMIDNNSGHIVSIASLAGVAG